MGLITSLNPAVIEDGDILLSKVDSTVASKSYVDTAINDITTNYATKTYVDEAIASAITTTLNTEV